jgi:hypothetical protein
MGRHHMLQCQWRVKEKVKWGSCKLEEAGTRERDKERTNLPSRISTFGCCLPLHDSFCKGRIYAWFLVSNALSTFFTRLHEGCHPPRKDLFFSSSALQSHKATTSSNTRILYNNLQPSTSKSAIRHGKRQGRQGRLPAQGAQGYQGLGGQGHGHPRQDLQHHHQRL